uniref:Uncharacterized protein n=1 Tax=uncultured prokaryote TaxID=198431 RepID=A0A0H5QK50_9ZZZZ|nr:hypothetical protein [uncultured prokaryote]
MDLTLRVYRSADAHKLTVTARPHTAATLGEFILFEGVTLAGLTDQPTATECLSAAYVLIASAVHERQNRDLLH